MCNAIGNRLSAGNFRFICSVVVTALFCLAAGTAFANGPPFSINLSFSAQGNSGLSPGPGSEFKPESSITLNSIVRDQYGNPADLKRYPCTPVYQIENVSHGLSNDTRPVASIVGNHLIFGPATGSFDVSAHCLENPKITTHANEINSLATGTDTFAQTAGTQYTQGLIQSGVLPADYFGQNEVASPVPNVPASPQSPTAGPSNSNGFRDALVIGGVVAGAVAIAAVAAGAASKTGGGGGSGSCPSAQTQQATCNQEIAQGNAEALFCIPTSCSCANGVAYLSSCFEQPEPVNSFECAGNSQPEYVCSCNQSPQC